MERDQIVSIFLLIICALTVSHDGLAQDNSKVNYWYAFNAKEGKMPKDSCLYRVDFFNLDSLQVKSESYGPCHEKPHYVSFLEADGVLLGEVNTTGAESIAYRYLYIEGVLSKKIANNHYPGKPAFVTYTYDEKGRKKEETLTDALGNQMEGIAVIKYSYTKAGLHRVTTNAVGDVVLIEDIMFDASGLESVISMRLSGEKFPFMVLKRYQ